MASLAAIRQSMESFGQDVNVCLGRAKQTTTNLLVSTGKSTYSLFSSLKDMRNDPAVFKKAGQVAISIIRGADFYNGTQTFGRLTTTLDAVNLHDFYPIVTRPRDFLYPINAGAIDAKGTLEGLIPKLERHFGLPEVQVVVVPTPDEIEDQRRLDIKLIAKTYLASQLQSMHDNNDVLRNTDEFLEAVKIRMQRDGAVKIVVNNAGERTVVRCDATDADAYGLNGVDLTGCAVPLAKANLLTRIMNINWLLVDIGTVGYYFKVWNLLDTAKIAQALGQFKVLSFVQFTSLEVWVRGGVCIGLVMQIILIIPQYYHGSEADRWRLGLDLKAAATDLIYHGACFVCEVGLYQIGGVYLEGLSIIARTTGIFCIVMAPKTQFSKLL